MPPKAKTAAAECGPGTGCEITELFKLLGRSHVMRILYLFLKEDPAPHRFVDIQRRLALSPNPSRGSSQSHSTRTSCRNSR